MGKLVENFSEDDRERIRKYWREAKREYRHGKRFSHKLRDVPYNLKHSIAKLRQKLT